MNNKKLSKKQNSEELRIPNLKKNQRNINYLKI